MHTVVLSDLHLSEAHEPDGKRPLWMAYKRREFFIDADFAALLSHLCETVDGPIELVLNGDVFDFDSVVQLPDDGRGRINWLARLRGLSSEEWMSRFKMECIIRDHPVWFAALSDFLAKGHRVAFVVGNHDVEVNWPCVQELIRAELPKDADVVFCCWFYLTNGTYISHGHQYDPNCAIPDPINPLISVHGRPRMRIPFGDLACRYLLNGMGYFNPNATDNYIMSGWQYVRFFVRYALLTQPLLIWTWFWGAIATLLITIRDHLRPAMRDPMLVDEKVRAVAESSNVTPKMVRQLGAIHSESACSRPWSLLRELWLDRGFLLMLLLFGAWQIILHVNIAVPIHLGWVAVPTVLLMLPYVLYARRVKSSVFAEPLLDERRANLIREITGAKRVVFGHTHLPHRAVIGDVEFFNSGFWSPAFAEPECENRLGTQSFVTIADGYARLDEWPPGASEPRPLRADVETEPPPSRRIVGAVPKPSMSALD